MRGRASLAAGVSSVVLLTTSVTACSVAPLAVCGILVDSTSYARNEESRRDIEREVPSFVGECDWVAFAAVTGNSETTVCREGAVPIAATRAENPNRNPKVEEKLRGLRLKEILPKAQKLLDCPPEGKGSDVLGALRYLGKQMTARRLPDRRHALIVFSDLVNNIGVLNVAKDDLDSDGTRAAKIEQLRQARLLPDLTGYDVRVHGFLRKEKAQPDRVPGLRSFWQQALEDTGAASVDLL
ncbi:hypothetical protein [Streptosporangium sp. V21-05]|uniref:hypothetical protein n=1 Tax=Streptosporangium sp. V21-05 TaxID=3446115 RepID=UPI003F52BE07